MGLKRRRCKAMQKMTIFSMQNAKDDYWTEWLENAKKELNVIYKEGMEVTTTTIGANEDEDETISTDVDDANNDNTTDTTSDVTTETSGTTTTDTTTDTTDSSDSTTSTS